MKYFSLEDPRLRVLACGFGQLAATQWNYSDVSLPCWRLYWNLCPGARISTDTFSAQMTPESAVLVAPNTIFSTVNTRKIRHLFVHFQMPTFLLEKKPPIAAIPMRDPLLGVAHELRKLLSADIGSRWKFSFTARSLVSLAMASLDLEMTDLPCQDARVLNVINYIDEHLQADTKNETLARQASMTVSALNRLFHEQVGHSLQEYARLKRIEKACHLLQFSEKSIDQIVDATGFCDRYHFSRIFKSIQGIPPAAFRRLHSMLPAP